MRKTSKRRVKKSLRMRTMQPMQPLPPIEYKNKTDFKDNLKMGLGLGAGFQLADFAADGVRGLFE
jgi:hypothetical protein